MNGLALCAGIGGLELGLHLALGDSYRTICYVEREAYNVACLVKRMEEGFLDTAPIWDDVGTFQAESWRGKVDIVTAGFPCQPFSLAGKRKREDDERHIWPDIARIIRECEPSFVFLENVHFTAFRKPFADLQAMGFSIAPPYECTAAEMGAGHIRRRVFVLAYRDTGLRKQSGGSSGAKREEWGRTGDAIEAISADAHSYGLKRDAEYPGETESQGREPDVGQIFISPSKQPRRPGVPSAERNPESSTLTGTTWWASEPGPERLVHGVSNRVERDRALGNAVVPIVAAKAFVELIKEIP